METEGVDKIVAVMKKVCEQCEKEGGYFDTLMLMYSQISKDLNQPDKDRAVSLKDILDKVDLYEISKD